MHMPLLDNVSSHTKFGLPSFIRSKDMMRPKIFFKMRDVTPTTSIWR